MDGDVAVYVIQVADGEDQVWSHLATRAGWEGAVNPPHLTACGFWGGGGGLWELRDEGISSLCMYVCMYVCMCVCVRARVHACMHACMHVCMHACMYVCMYVCVRACVPACMHACMYVCMHVCMYVCMCVYVSVCYVHV